MGQRVGQTFLRRRYTKAHQAQEKMLNSLRHLGNASQTRSELPLQSHQQGCHERDRAGFGGGGEVETLTHCWWGRTRWPCSGSRCGSHPRAIPLLGVSTRAMEHVHTETRTNDYSSIIRNGPKRLSADKWIKKTWQSHTMEHYSAVTRTGVLRPCTK